MRKVKQDREETWGSLGGESSAESEVRARKINDPLRRKGQR